jgi:hypothetical protein
MGGYINSGENRMSIRPKLRNAALLGAIAAVTATAWATQAPVSSSSYVPAYTVVEERTVVTTSEPIAVQESLSANESVVYPSSRESTPILVTDRTLDHAPIIVEERRLTEDERIQAEVIDRIATNPRLSGKIGVESRNSVVRLSGWTTTVGQARHAERDARSVHGVRYVENEIRPRVGGSV